MDNEKGKRLLEKTKLQYTRDILNSIQENPNLLDVVLEELYLDKEEFFEKLKDTHTNITFYDQAYLSIQEQKNR